MVMDGSPYDVTPAHTLCVRPLTDEELVDARQLWYAVFCTELGDYTYADRGAGEFRDHYEGPERLLGAFSDRQLAGVARLSLRREAEFLFDEGYQWGALAEWAGSGERDVMQSAALLSRVAVLGRWRTGDLFRALLEAGVRVATDLGAGILLVVPREGRLAPWQRHGFSRYAKPVTVRGWTSEPLARRLV